MNEINPVAGLKLDKWYKTLIPLGAMMVLVSLFHSPYFITQLQLFVFGIGWVLIGVGRWKDQRTESFERPETLFTPYMHGTRSYWKPGIGMLLIIVGIVAVVISTSCVFSLNTLCMI